MTDTQPRPRPSPFQMLSAFASTQVAKAPCESLDPSILPSFFRTIAHSRCTGTARRLRETAEICRFHRFDEAFPWPHPGCVEGSTAFTLAYTATISEFGRRWLRAPATKKSHSPQPTARGLLTVRDTGRCLRPSKPPGSHSRIKASGPPATDPARSRTLRNGDGFRPRWRSWTAQRSRPFPPPRHRPCRRRSRRYFNRLCHRAPVT